MKVRLLRKLARAIDGVDLSTYTVGDVLELSPQQANLLVAEGWAEVEVGTTRSGRSVREHLSRAAAALRPRRKSKD